MVKFYARIILRLTLPTQFLKIEIRSPGTENYDNAGGVAYNLTPLLVKFVQELNAQCKMSEDQLFKIT